MHAICCRGDGSLDFDEIGRAQDSEESCGITFAAAEFDTVAVWRVLFLPLGQFFMRIHFNSTEFRELSIGGLKIRYFFHLT